MGMALGFNGILIIVLSYLYWTATKFLDTTITTDYWGGDGFPRLVIALALILLIYDSIVTYKKLQRNKRENLQEKDVFEKPGLKLLFTGVILLALYVVIVEPLGYMITTALLVFIFMKAMGYKSNFWALIYTVILVAATLMIFGYVFGTSLPRGIGFLRELSFYIY